MAASLCLEREAGPLAEEGHRAGRDSLPVSPADTMGNCETRQTAVKVSCGEKFVPEHRIPGGGQRELHWQLSLRHLVPLVPAPSTPHTDGCTSHAQWLRQERCSSPPGTRGPGWRQAWVMPGAQPLCGNRQGGGAQDGTRTCGQASRRVLPALPTPPSSTWPCRKRKADSGTWRNEGIP